MLFSFIKLAAISASHILEFANDINTMLKYLAKVCLSCSQLWKTQPVSDSPSVSQDPPRTSS